MDYLVNILGKIGFDWQIALANLFNFLIILFILKKYAFGPIGKMIDERQKKINEGLNNAEISKNLLENTQKDYENVLLNAKKEANEIIQNAKKEAIVKREELVNKTKEEINTMLANGKKSLEIEKTKMLNETKKEIIGLVLQVSEKVLGSKVDQNYSDKVIQELKNI